VGASAALHGLLFPPFSLAALAWVALVPLFLTLRNRGPAAAALLAGVWAFLATNIVVVWLVPTLHEHFGWSLPASIAFLLGVSALAAAPFMAAAFGLVAALPARRAAPGNAFLLAAAWVAAEYARSHVGLRSPWAQLGDAHFASERLRQIADLTGVYGVSGVVALVNAALAELCALVLERRLGLPWPRGRWWLGAASATAVLLAVLVYGEWRRAGPPVTGSAMEVALVQGNAAPELRWRRSAAARVLRRYGRLTRDLVLVREGEARPDLIVWPENAIQTGVDDLTFGPPLRALARGKVPLLIGAPRREDSGGGRTHFNSASLLLADGAVLHYDKRRLLPFSETRPLGAAVALDARGGLDAPQYTAGREPGLFPVGGQLLGILICMEAVYPELAREAVREGAHLLVNLSNDGWYRGHGASQQHFAQAVFRAVETRRPLLRATTTGITAVVTPEGRVSARLPERTTDVLRFRVPVPKGPPSLYAHVGDVFALGCTLACVATPVFAALRRRHAVPEARDGRGPASRKEWSPPRSTA
jgi:apolipoprotein N-acyltransferase